MTFIPLSLFTLLTLFLPVIGSSPLPIPTSNPVEETLHTFATRAEGGGGGIGIGAIAGIIIAVLAVLLLLLLFFIIHNRPRSSIPSVSASYGAPPPAYTSPPTKTYYPSQKHYPTLPKYTGPNTSAAYVPDNRGIRFPSAIHPLSRGYYGQREEERGVRFGGVGVRGYH